MTKKHFLSFLILRNSEMRIERDNISLNQTDSKFIRRRSFLSGRIDAFESIASLYCGEKI